MQRTLGTLLVAVIVVFAGCGGVLGGGSNEPVETFTPVPEPTPKPTPTPVPQLAPGLTGQGIENVSALVAAHTSFLQKRSFTQTTNATGLASNGTVSTHYTSTLRSGPGGERVYFVSERNGSYGRLNFEFPVHTEAWFNDGRLFLKRTYANGTTTYKRMRQQQYGASGVGLRYRLESFGTANTTVAERFSRNGTTLYRVRGSVRNSEENVSLQLLVDSRGVIHQYRVVRQTSAREIVSKLVYETRFSKIGTTAAPEQPSWVDEALNQTTPIPENPRGPYDVSANGTETNGTASKTTTSG